MKESNVRVVGVIVALVAGCERGPPAVERVVLEALEFLVTTESELLGAATDIEIAPNGTVVVADGLSHRMLLLSPDANEDPRFLGNEGAGPGEFQRPGPIGFTGDTLHVFDRGNGRRQMMSLDGAVHGTGPMFPEADVAWPALLPDGGAVVGTFGADSSLATIYDRSGNRSRLLGVPVAPHQAVWDFTAMKRMAVEGEVPAQFRNQVRPVPGGDGGVWLVLTAEGEVRRYDVTGSLQVRASIHDTTMAATFDGYVRRNREEGRAFAFSGLIYVHDAIVIDDDLWLLLNVEEPALSTILVLDRDGMPVTRMEVPGISEANTFAVDRERGRLILGLQQAAAIVAVALP